MKFVRENISKLKGMLSERELQSIQKMMDNKPEKNLKADLFFLEKIINKLERYRRT